MIEYKNGLFWKGDYSMLRLLLKEVKECVSMENIPLEIALSTITSNPADILHLNKKGRVQEGYDADLCILDKNLQLVKVIARGKSV